MFTMPTTMLTPVGIIPHREVTAAMKEVNSPSTTRPAATATKVRADRTDSAGPGGVPRYAGPGGW